MMMSGYPDAYCVKCGHHTPTQQKHTVILQSNARALHGKCPKCGSDVFKFLPKKQKAETNIKSQAPKSQGATVTSLHEKRIEKNKRLGHSDLERQVLEMQKKQPIDYVLMVIGAIATGCFLYLIYR